MTALPTTSPPPARVRFRQPVSRDGFVDAAWWPRSNDLVAELPALLDVLWSADRSVDRVAYPMGVWKTAPRRITVQGYVIRLGGFVHYDPLMISLRDAWGRDSVDVLVIAPDTDPVVAERILDNASRSDSLGRAQDILDMDAVSPAGVGQ